MVLTEKAGVALSCLKLCFTGVVVMLSGPYGLPGPEDLLQGLQRTSRVQSEASLMITLCESKNLYYQSLLRDEVSGPAPCSEPELLGDVGGPGQGELLGIR